MKRFVLYSVLVIQVLLLLFLSFQFERINEHGETIQIKTALPDDEIYYDRIYDGTMYVEYEINKIPEENWKDSEEVDYNHRVYVLLEENEDGIYEVVEASRERLNKLDHQIVLQAFYNYHDTEQHFHYVRYGLEQIKHVEKYGSFRQDEQLLVTAKIGKWGQRMITNVEKINEE